MNKPTITAIIISFVIASGCAAETDPEFIGQSESTLQATETVDDRDYGMAQGDVDNPAPGPQWGPEEEASGAGGSGGSSGEGGGGGAEETSCDGSMECGKIYRGTVFIVGKGKLKAGAAVDVQAKTRAEAKVKQGVDGPFGWEEDLECDENGVARFPDGLTVDVTSEGEILVQVEGYVLPGGGAAGAGVSFELMGGPELRAAAGWYANRKKPVDIGGMSIQQAAAALDAAGKVALNEVATELKEMAVDTSPAKIVVKFAKIIAGNPKIVEHYVETVDIINKATTTAGTLWDTTPAAKLCDWAALLF